MSFTDPIADMLTRLRNAIQARKKEVVLPSSQMKIEIAKILKDEGYIRNYKTIEDSKQGSLAITLRYGDGGQNVILGLRRVSKPGCRVFCTKDAIPKAQGGLGLVIITTSRGVLSGRRCEELGAGGEVLCEIW